VFFVCVVWDLNVFDGLSEKFGDIFDRLKRRGALSPSDVSDAMREIRLALLEADVALPVVKDFIDQVKEQAVGHDVIKSVTPGQMIVKVVNDHLIKMLGPEDAVINVAAAAPVPILMVGLQGSGKTTTTAKLAFRLKKQRTKKSFGCWSRCGASGSSGTTGTTRGSS
jgi:signal recognition particle subunit SRP54